MTHEYQRLSTILGLGMYASAKSTASLESGANGGFKNIHGSLILLAGIEMRSVKCLHDWSATLATPFSSTSKRVLDTLHSLTREYVGLVDPMIRVENGPEVAFGPAKRRISPLCNSNLI